MASEFDTRTTQVQMSSPAVEKMLAFFEPKLQGILGGNICLLYTSDAADE